MKAILVRLKTMKRRIDAVTRASSNRVVDLVRKGEEGEFLSVAERHELAWHRTTMLPVVDALGKDWNALIEEIKNG